jgi:protein-S-isoprenylcysteine O-methyltransferase Ste14
MSLVGRGHSYVRRSRWFLIDDKTVDMALSLPFIALALVSLVQSFLVANPMIRAQLLFSVPLNLLGAYSLWVRRPAQEPTYMSEVLVPSVSLVMPFLVLNQGLVFGIPYSVPGLFPIALIGTVLALASLLYLKRSFAVLPTVRGVVIGGPYRIIRHPLYLGEALYVFGVMMIGFSAVSLLLFVITMFLMLVRIDMEERKMSTQADYRGYSLRVRYRLVPYIY